MWIFASKAAIRKIMVEEDLIKVPEYAWFRVNPNITNLLNERDRVAYKQKVYTCVNESLVPLANEHADHAADRLLSPGFSINYLNGLEPLMAQCVQAFVETLDARMRYWGRIGCCRYVRYAGATSRL